MEYGLVVWWLVAYLALMAVGTPIVGALFPRLANRGAGFALPAALAVLWLVVYLVGHLSLQWGLYVAVAVLAVVAFVPAVRGVELNWRRFGEAATVFTVAFLLMVAIRAVDAGVHPTMGEKFLDFGLTKAILRADVLPPEDMWFAGRPVQYYYGGHLIAAILTRITGTDPRYGYNLALAGFYAMLVSSAYSLAGSVAASRDVSRVKAGLFGAFFVGFASNLATAGTVVDRGVGYLFDGGPDGFGYWSASRVIAGTINEFPLFAWLNGDMHAHMMSTPFVLLAAAILFSYYLTPAEELRRRRLLVFGALPPVAGMLAVVNTWSFPTVGGLAFLTFALAPSGPRTVRFDLPDLPLSGVRDHNWWQEVMRYVRALRGALAVAGLGLLWSLPFWLGAGSTRSVGFLPDRSSMTALLTVHGVFVLLFAVHLYRHAVPHLDDEHVDEVLVMLALGIVLAWSGVSAAALAFVGPLIATGWVLLRLQADWVERAAASARGAARGVASDGVGDAGGEPRPDGGENSEATDDTRTAADAENGAPAATDAVGERLRDALGFETILMIAGAGLVVLVEFLYVKENAGQGRFNTVFKIYADVWVLWAVGAGAILAHLLDNHSPSLGASSDRWRNGFRLLAAVLVVSTSLYGVAALAGHFEVAGQNARDNPLGHPDEPTLDGFEYIEDRRGTDLATVQWFDDLKGQPNIVEAPGRDMYQWTNPISSLTGVPTLAGWQHERGYRGGDVYFSRADDVDTIYEGSAQQRAYLLDYYDVEYVYVGSNERVEYLQSDLAVFDSMEGVTLVEEWGRNEVYRVDRDRLNVPEDAD